ncbi:MAG TPA: MFS transporter [Clostridia bacterium]|nr:MFS transporter [Clostridia bacterium]
MLKNDKPVVKHQNRRYVGSRETMAYILFDVSKSFNINLYSERFVFDVLKIDLRLLAVVNFINTIWDVINDTFTGAIVDKTRTRFGKFKPYLIAFAIPGTIGTCIYWMMPVFFSDGDPMNSTKFFIWLLLALVREGADTFRLVAQTGFLSTITPNPIERTSLITKANLLSGFLGEQIPEILMGVLIDLVNHNIIKFTLKSVYVTMGLFTTIVSGVLALSFFIVGKERVPQSINPPSIKEGFKSILQNKPILLITLSEFLSAFSINAGMNNYFIDVLGSASIKNIVGVPGAIVSTISYTYIPWARKRFSTKLLWIVSGSWGDFLMSIVFFLGSIGGIGPNGLYNKRSAMIPIIMAQETLFTMVMGLRRVIPQEIFNEAMDYCEWKTGFRTEGMTSTAKGLATKLVKSISGTIKPILMNKFGYNLKAGFGKQTYRTKYYLFAMCTILPFVTGILGIVPKFFYDLSGKKRDRMYDELFAQRLARQKLLQGIKKNSVIDDEAEKI